MQKPLVILVLMIVMTRPGVAGERETFEALVQARDWHAAAMLMFDKGHQLSPGTGSAYAMAKAGYYPEALASIEDQSRGATADSLILIAREGLEISYVRRLGLLAKVEREATEQRNFPVIASVSAAYLAIGAESDAKRVFAAFMASPDIEASDYRRLAESFERFGSAVQIGTWVMDALSARLALIKPGYETAFAFEQVGLLYARNGDAAKAQMALLMGLDMAIRIPEQRPRSVARNALGATALKLGAFRLAKRYGEYKYLAGHFALYAARTGDIQVALDILPELSVNFYVNHKDATTRAIIREALDGGDVPTAKIFINLLSSDTSVYWLRIAEIERAQHRMSEAAAATDTALKPYLQEPLDASLRYYFRSLYQMATMLIASGEADKAKLLAERLDPLIDAIKPKIPSNYIEPRRLAAAVCSKIRDFACSARQILAAYEAVQLKISLDGNSGQSNSAFAQAREYLELGSTLATIDKESRSGSELELTR